MTIGIPLNPFGEVKPSGLGVFNKHLVIELVRLRPAYRFIIYLRGKDVDCQDLEVFSNVEIVYIKDSFLWKDRAFWRDWKTVDIWLYTNPSLPFFFTPKIGLVTALDFGIHDEKISLDARRKLMSRVLRYFQGQALTRAFRILSVSQSTTNDLISLFSGVNKDKISLTGCGYTPICTACKAPRVFEDFYLIVGAIKPRKNQYTAVQAFIEAKRAGLPSKLIIVGSGSGEYYESVVRLIAQSGYAKDISLVGFCDQATLEQYYKNARALIFPSHVEGFGMAILEAMSCGVPVISSKNSGQGEVANGYALTVDSRDMEDFKKAILQLQDSAELERLSTLSLQRSKDFSWQKTAQKYIEVIESVG